MPASGEQLNRNATLRRADQGDARLLAQLGARLFEQAFGAANDPADMRAYLAAAFSVEQQSAELAEPQSATWIAEDAGRAAVGYTTVTRGGVADGVTGTKPAEVRRIYVDQPWQGRGVSHALMSACIEQARAWHCDVVWLGVWERNPRAIAFYEKVGFRPVGRQTFELGADVQRDIVMAKVLV
jgi:GNAT superfamily N-acetyltransferase